MVPRKYSSEIFCSAFLFQLDFNNSVGLYSIVTYNFYGSLGIFLKRTQTSIVESSNVLAGSILEVNCVHNAWL